MKHKSKAKRKSKMKRKNWTKGLCGLRLKGPKKTGIIFFSRELLKSNPDAANRLIAEECKRMNLGAPLTIESARADKLKLAVIKF